MAKPQAAAMRGSSPEPFRMTYNPGPVTLEFMKDQESRALLLIGPVGCLSADTEYLTPTGWKRFDQYTPGDQVAEFSLDTSQLTYRTPKYVKYPCGRFLHFQSECGRIDQLLSPEHTVLFHTGIGWQTANAWDLACGVHQRWFGEIWFPIGLDGAEKIPSKTLLPMTTIPSEDGFKYCFETQSGFFPARRNGRIFITGNTGKTTAAAYKILMLNSRWVRMDRQGRRRSRYAVVRNTMGQLKDSTIRAYLDWFPPGEFGGGYHQTDKNATYRIADREIEICFRALDDEADYKKILSTEFSGAHVDETKEIPSIIVTGLMSRFRFPPKKDYDEGVNPFKVKPQCILTTNYPNRDHWLYRDFVKAPKLGYRIFEQTQEENKHNLPDDYYENQAIDYADRPDMLRTMVLGQWGMTYQGKLVFPEWSNWPQKTFIAPLPLIADPGKILYRGWDNTGLHPACTISQMNANMQWCILKEFWHEDIGITDFTEWVHVWCQDELNGARFKDVVDPASRNRGTDPTKGSSLDWMKKYFNDVGAPFNWEYGIQTFSVRREAVASRIGMGRNGLPMMLIDPACTLVIDGFDGGYHRKEIGNTGVFKTEPHKDKYADVQDSCQYVATRLFSTKVDSKPVRSVTQIMASGAIRSDF